ncbi:MAG: glycosyltransferase [Roseobacter sp.]
MKVLIVVTHLLGTGHLARALVLARAHHAAGHDVHVISGGMPAPHLDADGIAVTQLPALKSDGVNFRRLLDAQGSEATPGLLDERRAIISRVLADTQPDVVMTELFPFGRRVLSGEFTALLEASVNMVPRPLICASIRDILAPPSKPAKAEATDALISAYYDAVVVHSDPQIAPLDASWPVSDSLRQKLHYSGFVCPPPAADHRTTTPVQTIIVSAGGGTVGGPINTAAIEAASLAPDLNWHLLVGGADGFDRVAELQDKAPENLTIEPVRSDFRAMLYRAAASVSMCGYNTALDILQAGTPAVFVPFDAGGEVEQSLRARALEKLDGIEVLKATDLIAQELVNAVRRALNAPPRSPSRHSMDGAQQTVEILFNLSQSISHGR